MHNLFQLYFEKTYIIVVPSYKDTLVHRHNMLHVFFGNGDLQLQASGKDVHGNIIILENDIDHKAPDGEIAFFLFVDPTSHFAEVRREKFLRGEPIAAFNLPDSIFDKTNITEEIIKKIVFDFAGEVQLSKLNLDERILQILQNIDSFKHLGERVSELAEKYSYSESYLTHLFKNENGGYSLFEFFTQNSALNKKSLIKLRDKITGSGVKVACTGHSGIRRDMSKLFAHIDESAVSKRGKTFDPTAPKSIRK